MYDSLMAEPYEVYKFYDLNGERKKLKLYPLCNSDVCRRKVKSNRSVVKKVKNIHATWCPDCGYALCWVKEGDRNLNGKL